MKRFVIVVDTQRDFMMADGALSVAGAEALIDNSRRFLESLRPEEVEGVLFTFDTHEPDVYAGSAEAEQFPIHCVRGSAGWENMLSADWVDPAIPAWRIEKGVFDMWAEDGATLRNERDPAAAPVDRDAFFGALAAREVVVIGVAADYCVKWAIDGLIARGFSVVVPEALTRGIARQIGQVVEEDFAGKPVAVGRELVAA